MQPNQNTKPTELGMSCAKHKIWYDCPLITSKTEGGFRHLSPFKSQ